MKVQNREIRIDTESFFISAMGNIYPETYELKGKEQKEKEKREKNHPFC